MLKVGPLAALFAADDEDNMEEVDYKVYLNTALDQVAVEVAGS